MILEFLERPEEINIDTTMFRYDEALGLTVDIDTGLPVIDRIDVGTETFTRAGESSDSDQNDMQSIMTTQTETKVGGEDSDADRSPISFLMVTETFTASNAEGADSDLDRPERLYFGNSSAH